MLARKREAARKRYAISGRRLLVLTCKACGNQFKAWRRSQKLCQSCYKASLKTGYMQNGYEVAGGSGYCFKHRKIAETVLHRKLNSNEVVHHLNCVETDNAITNLVVMSRQKHGALHKFLREQRVIMEQSIKENFENCWKNSILPMTKAWLETANVKVEKLWEVSQSAAEPLNNSNGEGSETVHEAPAKGDDTVQTTTSNIGLGDEE